MKTNFYKYVTETYKNEQNPKGDFAYDMQRDIKMPKYKNDKNVFYHLQYTMMDNEVRDVYYELKKEYFTFINTRNY